MSGPRWADMSLEQRYEALHRPRPVAEPAAPVSTLASTMRNVTWADGELEEQDRNARRARALREIEGALRAEREAHALERRAAVDRVIHGSTLGQFATGGLR